MITESVFASEGTIDYTSDDSLPIEELEARLKAEVHSSMLASYL
jgi:hypothetical protein